MPTPAQLWYLVDRNLVPKVLDPDSAWWGKVPTSKEDLKRMFPGSEGTMATYLKDIASVPASAIAEIEGDVKQQLAMGEIGLGEIGQAIEEGLQGYALGLPPRMKRAPGQRPPRKFGKGIGSKAVDAPGHGGKMKQPGAQGSKPYRARHYMVQGPVKMMPQIHGGNINGLGDILDDAAKAISSGAQTGALPPSSVNQLINDAVSVITGTPVPAAPATTPASSIAKTAIPIGMVALLGAAAWLMTRGGGKKYRRNPGRRRSSRRGGGGMDMKNIFLWGGGGLAAYFLLLRPGGLLMPKALTPATTTPTIPGMTAAQQAALASGVKAAPSIIDSIAKLFGGGSTPATTTAAKPAATAPSSGFVTNYSQIGVQQPSQAPDSGFVTSYDDASAA